MAGDDGDWVVTKPGGQGGSVSPSSSAPPTPSGDGGMGMGGGDVWTVTPTKESKAAPAPSASADDVPGTASWDPTPVFFRHLVGNLPGGEDAAAFLDSFSTGKSVHDQKAALQAQEAQDWDEHPWAAGTGAAGSYIGQAAALPVTGLEEGVAQGVTRLAPWAVKAAPTIGRATVGAGYGALQGGTEGSDLWDTSGALWGAGLGGAGAAVIPPAVGGALKGVGRWAGLITPETEAARKMVGAFDADAPPTGLGGALSKSDFAAAKTAGQTPMAADLGGENVRELADEAQLNSPTARAKLKDVADARYAAQQDQFSKFLDGQFPGKDLNTQTMKDETDFASRQANSTAYNAAYGDPKAKAVWSSDLANLMRDPNVQRAIPNAQSKAASAAVDEQARTGQPVPIPANPFVRDFDGNWGLRQDAQGNTATPSLKWWDYVNRGLGDQVSAARRAGNMDDARVIGGIQTQLQGALDKQVPQFATARATAAGFFNEKSLIDAAVKFDRTNNESALSPMLKDLAGRDDDEREIFARAYAAQLKQRAANPGQQADLVKQFNSQTIKDKMDAALNTAQNPTRSQEIRAYMMREQAFNTLRNAFGNSKTAQRQAAQQRQGEGHGLVGQIAHQFTAPVSGAITGAVGGWHETPESATWEETGRNVLGGGALGFFAGLIAKQHGKVNTATWNEIARQLASDDPNVYENAVKRVARRPLFMKQFEQALTPLVGWAGGQAAGAQNEGAQ
jgi:hypothetical protein